MSKKRKTSENVRKAARTDLPLAQQLLAEVMEMRGIQGSSETQLSFSDGSVLSFHAIAGDPRPKGIGGAESWARKFYDSVKGFELTSKGVEFIFKDDSRANLDFGGATFTRTTH